jgi:hypothetical protein
MPAVSRRAPACMSLPGPARKALVRSGPKNLTRHQTAFFLRLCKYNRDRAAALPRWLKPFHEESPRARSGMNRCVPRLALHAKVASSHRRHLISLMGACGAWAAMNSIYGRKADVGTKPVARQRAWSLRNCSDECSALSKGRRYSDTY